MAKIVIAELDIDVSALLKSTKELKDSMSIVKKEQDLLKASGKENSEQFIENTAVLKNLTSAYNQNIKVLTESNKATFQEVQGIELLNLALETEVSSISEARAQNKLLNQLRNDTNVSTAEGVAQLNALNAKLDSNNEFIKQNADAYTQQKINVGNYKESISEALGELNLMNGGIGGFIERSNEAGGAGNLLTGSLKGAASGFLGMAKAGLAFIATPIGAVIAALVAAFALIKAAMNRSEDATNKLKVAFSAVTGVFNLVMKAIAPLGEFLIDGIVMGFEMAAKAAEKAAGLISDGLSILGFDSAAEGVKNFTNEVKAGVKEAMDLTRAEQALEASQRKSRLTQLEYQKTAEKFRQIRDDENRTIAERIKANDDLGATLQRQLKAELAIAQQALNVANLRIKAEGATKENLDAQADALTEIADIQERVTGQESEQLANRVSLQKEAAEKAKEIREKAAQDAIDKSKQELDLFLAQQGFKKKSTEDEYKFNKKLYDKELADAKLRFNLGKISKTEYETEKLNIGTEFAKKNADLALAEGQAELDRIKANAGLTTDAKMQAELDFQKLRLESGVLNEQQYQEAVKAVRDEYDQIRADKELADKEAKMERDAIDLENLRASQQLTFEQDVELQKEQNAIRLQQELEAAEKSGADQQLIKDKYAKLDKQLDQAVQDNKLQLASATFANLADIFGKQSKLGKAFAIYQTTIDTYQAITKALAASPPPYNYVQAAAIGAQGFRNVAQISGAKFEKGGIQEIGGKSHSAGGTKFYGEDGTTFEAQSGEGIGILNRSAFGAFMNFNNKFGSGRSTSGMFAGGGIITQGVRPETPDLEGIVNAIATLPPPVVAVEEIQTVGNRYVTVKSGADL